MVKNGQNGQKGLKWSNMVPNGPIWSQMVPNGLNSENGQNGQKW